MFKIGDTITIQHLTTEQRKHILYVNWHMEKYEGQTGQIMNIDKVDYGQEHVQNEYEVCFQNEAKWWWLEEWIKTDIEYHAF